MKIYTKKSSHFTNLPTAKVTQTNSTILPNIRISDIHPPVHLRGLKRSKSIWNTLLGISNNP